MAEKTFRVFYAWQSDSPSSVNRNFIESAATLALKQIREAGTIEAAPRLDKDTKDVPGIPDIANTILEKIRSSDVFLADISFVGMPFGTGEEVGEPMPNSNVMIELGYALSELGPERIIYVMNTHYGPESKLPFDLRNRRWPITYGLAPESKGGLRNDEKTKVTSSLKKAIEIIAKLPPREENRTLTQRVEAIELFMNSLSGGVAQNTAILNLLSSLQANAGPAQMVTADPPKGILQKRDLLVQRVLNGQFENLVTDHGILVLNIMPLKDPPSPLELFAAKARKASNDPTLGLKPLAAAGWSHRVYGNRLVTFSTKGQGNRGNENDAVTEITVDGVISAAGHRVICVDPEFLGEIMPKDVQIIPSIAFEHNIIDAVSSYTQVLSDFGADGPWLVALGFINMIKSRLYVGIRYGFGGREYTGSEILPQPIEISKDVCLQDHQLVAKALRPIFDFIWRDYNFPGSLNYNQSGEWVGQA